MVGDAACAGKEVTGDWVRLAACVACGRDEWAVVGVSCVGGLGGGGVYDEGVTGVCAGVGLVACAGEVAELECVVRGDGGLVESAVCAYHAGVYEARGGCTDVVYLSGCGDWVAGLVAEAGIARSGGPFLD